MSCSAITTAGATRSPRAWNSSLPFIAAGLAGCPLIDAPPPGGVVEGQVLFASRGAPGKVVTLLLLQNGQPVSVPGKTAPTDAGGVYRFGGLSGGKYLVTYVSQAVPDGNRIPREPNEIGFWRTRSKDVTATTGARMPPFDVAYNGLIYPSTGTPYVVSADMPLPFHWSTHLQGQKYRLNLYNNRNGTEPAMHTSDWVTDPTALYKKNVNVGNYSWKVAIDAGEAGEGSSLVREVDMGPPGSPGGDQPEIP